MPSNFYKHKDYLYSRGGWLLDEETELLYYLATRAVDPIVEIGSFKGKSTSCFILGSQDGNNVNVVSIDPYMACDECPELDMDCIKEDCMKNIKSSLAKNEKARVVHGLIVDYSGNVFNDFDDGSMGLVFIDGAHDYKNVKADTVNYIPKIKKGGLVLLHDSTNENEFVGVYAVFNELKKDSRLDFIGQVRSISIFMVR